MIAPPDDLIPFLAVQRDALRFALAFREPFDTWQQDLRAEWLASLPPHDGPAVLDASDTLRSGDHTLRWLRFRYASGDIGEAALLLPAKTTGPLPAVVLLHDHGGTFDAGWRKMIADGIPASHHYEGRHLGNDLAAAGFAVLSIDAFGWGSRYYGGYERQQAIAYHALQLGWSLAGIVAADDLQSVAWLAEQPEIDPRRIGVMGFSHGGFRAWQAAALCQDIAACASLSWIGRRQDMLSRANPLLRGHSAYYFLHPTLATRADYPDMIGLAADRSLFIRAGNNDPHMPKATVEAAFAEVRTIAQAGGGTMYAALFAGGHACPLDIQSQAITFLKCSL